MQGYTYSGVFRLGGDFPASLNTADDPSQLKPFESPACYGIDSEKNGRLAVGSIPTSVNRKDYTRSVGGTTYNWIYNRLWLTSGTGETAKLEWGAPHYDDVYYPHGLGGLEIPLDGSTTIKDIQPALGSQLWVLSSDGSYFIAGANNLSQSDFETGQLVQELKTTDATYAMTLNGLAIVSNGAGVYGWNGNSLTEFTRPVRSSLGSFGAVEIKADYTYQKIIGTNKFAIDTTNGKLYDYGTSGFLYTTPTMVQSDGKEPFTVNSFVLSYEMITAGSATIAWQSRAEDGNWYDEEEIVIVADTEGQYSRVEKMVENPVRTCHKYAFRITSMSSNVAIEQVSVNVNGLAVEAVAE